MLHGGFVMQIMSIWYKTWCMDCSVRCMKCLISIRSLHPAIAMYGSVHVLAFGMSISSFMDFHVPINKIKYHV